MAGMSAPTQEHVSAWSLIEQQQRLALALDWQPPRTPVVAVDSEKGGVGKSALAGGLVAVMSARGYRVLAADLDPRATLTAELDAEGGQFSINDLLYSDPTADPDELPELAGLAAQAVRPAGAAWKGVDVLAAERALAHRETDPATGLEQRLATSLRGVTEGYDLVVLDLPPRAGGKLVGAGMLAATHVLYPATLDEDGLVGVRDARRTRKVLSQSGSNVTEVGVLRNVVAQRTKLAKFYDDTLWDEFDGLLLDTVIPRRVIRQEARGGCVPVSDASTPDAAELVTAYTAVLNEIARRG